MKTKFRIMAVALIAGGTMFAQTRLSVGIGVGGYGPGYYPPPAYGQYVPPCPGPDYAWVDGYWAPQGGQNVWVGGFWRSPYAIGYRVAPRFAEPRYYNSFRGSDRGFDNRAGQRFDNRGGERFDNRGGERYGNRGGQRNDNRGGQRNDNGGHGYSNGFRR